MYKSPFFKNSNYIFIMDDKERIEMIMQEKNLSNVIFCAKTNIAPASLSHIIGGRTKPTLPILRNIIAAFPDLNPEWVFMGTGEMYTTSKHDSSQIPSGQNADATLDDNSEQRYLDNSNTSSINNLATSSKEEYDTSNSVPTGQDAHIFNFGDANNGTSHERLHKPQMPSISDIVRETIVAVQKPQRKIVEVRIFFDDGTFETFSSNK